MRGTKRERERITITAAAVLGGTVAGKALLRRAPVIVLAWLRNAKLSRCRVVAAAVATPCTSSRWKNVITAGNPLTVKDFLSLTSSLRFFEINSTSWN
ncbi:hypothetical protein PIB30_033163 [Stylosanthes scabra]|uniref:Secreted protein n=1 Tax=Stylosanthes scabra TaxID=79078 RepID=A0ABU6Y9M6_9FABA|nr:hypothetical protein [Stylosanthes scabra]